MQGDLQNAFSEAVRLHQTGQLGAAEKAYHAILAAAPGHADALHLLGVLLMQGGRHQEGVNYIEQAIALSKAKPVPEFHGNIATGLRALGDLVRAASHLKTVVTLRPADAVAHFRAGLVLLESGANTEAAAYFGNAVALKPDFAEAHSNLGVAYKNLGKFDDAVTVFRAALKFQPKNAAAHYSLGIALKDVGKIEEAATCFSAAATIDPQHAGAQWNLALARLLSGDFTEGWKTFAWYGKIKGAAVQRFTQPAWDGGDITGKTILLYEEHGYGDTLQFARYAADIKKRAGRVLMQCRPEMVDLLSTVPGVDAVVRDGNILPPFDCHASIFLLPKLMDTRVETIPGTVPYFFPSPGSVAGWRERGVLEAARNVGVVWRGNKATDPRRAVPLDQMARIWRAPGFNWLSLQVGAAPDELSALAAAGVRDCGSRLSDWADTAALISELDLVITIDTAVAHLAGALGKPVWILLPFVPDWRWLLERQDSPWYPTARLFRQPVLDGWDAAVDNVIEALRDL